jgi:hypothetical protein
MAERSGEHLPREHRVGHYFWTSGSSSKQDANAMGDVNPSQALVGGESNQREAGAMERHAVMLHGRLGKRPQPRQGVQTSSTTKKRQRRQPKQHQPKPSRMKQQGVQHSSGINNAQQQPYENLVEHGDRNSHSVSKDMNNDVLYTMMKPPCMKQMEELQKQYARDMSTMRGTMIRMHNWAAEMTRRVRQLENEPHMRAVELHRDDLGGLNMGSCRPD